MEALANFFQTYLPFVVNHLELFLFLGGILEGMNVFILAGFLTSFGYLNIFVIFPLLFLAHILNGYMWYYIGRHGGARALDKWGYKHKISESIIKKVDFYFNRYSGRAIVLSKFTYSLEIATLLLAGSLKYDIKKFSQYNALGSLGWVTMTFFIGYFFGQSFRAFFTVVKNFFLASLFLILALIIIYILGIYLKKVYLRQIASSYRLQMIKKKIDDLWANR